MHRLSARSSLLLVGFLVAAPPLHAQITLSLVDTYNEASPFGIAFDGTNVWWSNSGGTLFEMSTSGVLTGNSMVQPGGWSALAWDSSRGQLVTAGIFSSNVTWFDRYTAANQISVSKPGGGLIDGLDVSNGELWYSPDVSNVFRYAIDYGPPLALTATADGNPFLAGTFSGVARANVGANSYILTVNDASSPRQLCVNKLDKSLVGCQDFVNQRYEDLAFDGRYVWAADFYGNKIDKFDVLGDDGSIFVPGEAPEPNSVILLGSGLLGLALWRRRRQTV